MKTHKPCFLVFAFWSTWFFYRVSGNRVVQMEIDIVTGEKDFQELAESEEQRLLYLKQILYPELLWPERGNHKNERKIHKLEKRLYRPPRGSKKISGKIRLL